MPVLDIYPFATTSPIYVRVGDEEIRSPDDTRYFITWLDRLAAGVGAYQWFNTPAERAHVLDQIARARTEFERR
jgi:hypothetical protein